MVVALVMFGKKTNTELPIQIPYHNFLGIVKKGAVHKSCSFLLLNPLVKQVPHPY
jgi:hypothetical protein